MMDTYQDIEKLRSYVRDKRTQFILKIYHMLSYMKYHHDDISKVGISWDDDEGMMLINTSILAHFVGIKANSVNKNFKFYGILKVKAPRPKKLDLSNQKKWIYRKSTMYTFNSKTPLEEVLKYKPNFGIIEKTTFLSSQIMMHKNELNNGLKISSVSLLDNRSLDWKNMFKSNFARHWIEMTDSSNAIYIKDVIKYLKNSQNNALNLKPSIESKILLILQFFSNNNTEMIDIDDYFVFCSFFGIGHAIIGNIEKLPFENEEKIDNQVIVTRQNQSMNDWFELNKYDQSLIKLMTNQVNETWDLCFSNEPGIYILINKHENCIFQTKICFDAIDNSYSIGTLNEGTKKFLTLNDLISFLNLNISNHLNLELNFKIANVPADYLHFNMYNAPIDNFQADYLHLNLNQKMCDLDDMLPCDDMDEQFSIKIDSMESINIDKLFDL